MNRIHIAFCTASLCAFGAWAETTHSTDETIASIAGNNVFNGKNTTIIFETQKDTVADGWLSVEGNGSDFIVFKGKNDSDDYGYVINGSTYVSGGGGSGSFKIESGSFTFKNQLYLGQNGNNTAELTVAGGVFDASSTQVNLGQSENTKAYYMQTGGSVCNNNYYISPGKDSYAEMEFTGGVFVNNGVTTFGWNDASSLRVASKIVISGTADVVLKGNVTMGYAKNRQDYINLNGGSLSVKYLKVWNSDSNATLTFNGGVLKALDGSQEFLDKSLACKISSNGAVIDTQEYAPTIQAELAHDESIGDTVDGGLTKKGAGTLTFTTMPTFTGKITVLAGAGNVLLPTGATIAAGDNTKKYDNGTNTIYSNIGENYETTTVGSETVYVLKTWLADAYGDDYTSGSVPEGFSTRQSGVAMSGLEAYALGFTGEQFKNSEAALTLAAEPGSDGTIALSFDGAPAPRNDVGDITYRLLSSSDNYTWTEGTALSVPVATISLGALSSDASYFKLRAEVAVAAEK